MILTKRRRFILSAALTTFGLLATQWVSVEYRYVAIFGLFLITYLVSAWALFDDLKGVEWFTLLVLPSMYTAAMALFNFLLPEHPLSRTIVLTLYGIGMYALYLTENIFSVAAVRTIQLVRAAHAVGFLMTILTMVLLYNTLFSLQLPYYASMVISFFIVLPLFLQGLWAMKLERKFSRELVVMSVSMSVMIMLLTGMLAFLPVTVWIASLYLGTAGYVSLGLLQHAVQERLFVRTIYEYTAVGIFVFFATFFVIPWR